MSHFAIVTRDELWSLDRRALLESRLMHGSADLHDNRIDARDDRDDELLDLCERECERVREAIGALTEGRARSVVSAQSPLPPGEGGRRPGEGRTVIVDSTISVTILDLSIVTTLPNLSSDYEMLVEIARIRPETSAPLYRDFPIVWRNGSAAVLLHEAAGHPAEHGQAPLAWPSWLTVTDESTAGQADLLGGEAPRASRRKSFSDVPLRRMTNVVVGGRSPEVKLRRRIDILLIAGGRYEPLTESVTLSISAADLVDGQTSTRLRPFVVEQSRAEIARAVRGAAGEVRRYPGVVCSREGQELFVASHAPDLLTEF